MKNQDLKGTGLSPRIMYSEAFKRAIVREYERGILNKAQIKAKYGIGGMSRVLDCCRKYGKLVYSRGNHGRPMKEPQKQRIKDLDILERVWALSQRVFQFITIRYSDCPFIRFLCKLTTCP